MALSFEKIKTRSDLGKRIHQWVLLNHPFFQTHIDTHLKWIPFATVFGLHFSGIKTRSHWFRQVIIAMSTEAIRYFLADSLKKLVHEHRPAPYSGNHSFPSGHTSSSFAGAEFMRRELKGSLPFFSYAGYFGAVATAAIRVMKSRHWLKDVIAGAALGILSAKASYFIFGKIKAKKNKGSRETAEDIQEKLTQLEPAEG